LGKEKVLNVTGGKKKKTEGEKERIMCREQKRGLGERESPFPKKTDEYNHQKKKKEGGRY